MSRDMAVANANRAFFRTAMVLALQDPMIDQPIRCAQPKAPLHPFSHCGFEGAMMIDTLELDQETFIIDLRRTLCQVAGRLSETGFFGGRCERARVDVGIYRFEFRILAYWTDRPDEPPPTDPDWSPTGLEKGRTVEFKIGLLTPVTE